MRRAVVVWILGLVTAVPWATWHLLFEAPRDQYALLITGILFWIFGYWSLVGPLLVGMKARAVMRALERAQSPDDLAATLRSAETRDVAIDLLAGESGLPRFLARRLYDRVLRRIAEREVATARSPDPGRAA
jgi:hypothetical protein